MLQIPDKSTRTSARQYDPLLDLFDPETFLIDLKCKHVRGPQMNADDADLICVIRVHLRLVSKLNVLLRV